MKLRSQRNKAVKATRAKQTGPSTPAKAGA
jgi:hypothetical protein